MLKKIGMLLFICVFLCACREEENPNLKTYLLMHPHVLSKEVAACQDGAVQSSPRCQQVIEAAGEMSTLIDEHQRNPLAFGQRILEAEMLAAKTGGDQDQVRILLAVVGLNSPE
jgi:hypothetical protein